jgi:hypothetical protein
LLSRLIRRFNRSDPLQAQVEQSISRGTGLRKGEWVIDGETIDATVIAATTEEMLQWCRDRIAETRRPYGIDQMALAVACAEPGGTAVASASFGVFRPVEFYQEDGIADRLTHFMESLRVEDLTRRPTVRFAAALFSWGDVARDTIFRDNVDEAAA